jgi:DNA primase
LSEHDLWRYRVGFSTEGKYARRAIFSSLDTDGEVNYFVSRSVDNNPRLRYLNATADKTSIVFNDIDIDWDKKIYLVEGVFDLIALKENGTCLLGSTLTENSLLFKKIVANEAEVILCLDNDMVRKTGKIADLLTQYGCEVSIMDTSSAKDIAEMSQGQLENAKAGIAQWDLRSSFSYKIANIKSGSLI